MLNRSDQPRILEPEQLVVQRPERIKLPNGVPLSVLNAGDNEVTRIDLLMAGGRWQQKQPLQALFTNRMLREGTRRYDAAQIAEKLDYYGAWLELSSASEYAYVTLYSLNKYLPQTLDILESIVKEPVFPEKELGVIVDNNIQQFLVNSSKVDFLAHRGLVKAAGSIPVDVWCRKRIIGASLLRCYASFMTVTIIPIIAASISRVR